MHLREQCFKIIGYPDKKKGKGRFQSSNTGFRPLPQTMNVSNTVPLPNTFPAGFSLQPFVQNFSSPQQLVYGRKQTNIPSFVVLFPNKLTISCRNWGLRVGGGVEYNLNFF